MLAMTGRSNTAPPDGGGGVDPEPTIPTGYTVRPYGETVDAPVVAASTAYLTFGSTTFAGSRRIAWGDPTISTVGLTPSTRATTPPSVENAQVASTGHAPYGIEFTIAGATQFAFHITTNQDSRPEGAVRFYVDGNPTTAAPVELTSAAVRVQLPDAGTHRVRIDVASLWFACIDVPASATVTPTAKRAPTLMIYGDSWVEGASYDTPMGLGGPNHPNIENMAWMTGRILDAPTFVNGISGTGYVAGSPNYRDDSRFSQIVYADPDVLLVFGTINDDGIDVSAQAASFFARVATELPDCKVIVCGPQSFNTESNTPDANHGTLLAAAADAPNVVGIIDPLTEAWITGTGNSASPTGDGNADVFHNGYNLRHLTLAGNRYYAERLAARIAAIIPPEV